MMTEVKFFQIKATALTDELLSYKWTISGFSKVFLFRGIGVVCKNSGSYHYKENKYILYI